MSTGHIAGQKEQLDYKIWHDRLNLCNINQWFMFISQSVCCFFPLDHAYWMKYALLATPHYEQDKKSKWGGGVKKLLIVIASTRLSSSALNMTNKEHYIELSQYQADSTRNTRCPLVVLRGHKLCFLWSVPVMSFPYRAEISWPHYRPTPHMTQSDTTSANVIKPHTFSLWECTISGCSGL